MSLRSPDTFRPRTSATAELLAHWTGLARGRVPKRRTFDPLDVPRLLPHLVLFERRADDDFLVRVMGTAVGARIGMDATGKNALSVFDPALREQLQHDLNHVLNHGCGHLLEVEDTYPSGQQTTIEVIRLPLLDDDGTPTFILSATAPLGAQANAARLAKPVQFGKPTASHFFGLPL